MRWQAQRQEMAEFVRRRWPCTPDVGVVLGSGLGVLARELKAPVVCDYAEIPHFVATTAVGHRGRLLCGEFAGRHAIFFQGRFHLYEGHSPQQAALPIRLLQGLGCPIVVLTNAAGGVRPTLRVGDVMLIDDHINLLFANPLRGPRDELFAPRCPDMSTPYDRTLQERLLQVARGAGVPLQRGVYVGMRGPTYETRAEYRMCRRLGGDAVGMSTIPETLAARHAGMRVAGLSTITNVGSPDAPLATSGHDVVHAAAAAAGKIAVLLRGLVAELPRAGAPAATREDPS